MYYGYIFLIIRFFHRINFVMAFHKDEYAVVEFKDSQEVEVVPIGWIIRDNEGNDKDATCFWPLKFTSKSVIRKDPVSSSWAKYPVTIMETADSYERASKKRRKAQFSSNLDTTDDEYLKRKRKITKPTRYITEESDSDKSSSNDDCYYRHPPPVKKLPVSKVLSTCIGNKKAGMGNQSHLHNSVSNSEDSSLPFQLRTPLSSCENLSVPVKKLPVSKVLSIGNKKCGMGNQSHLHESLSDSEDLSLPSQLCTPLSSCENLSGPDSNIPLVAGTNSGFAMKLLKAVEEVKSYIKEIKGDLSSLSAKVNVILEDGNTDRNKQSEKDTEVFMLIPVSADEELAKLEDLLKIPEHFVSMVRHLTTKSTSVVADSANAMMAVLMTNDYAKGFNYCGTNRKRKLENDEIEHQQTQPAKRAFKYLTTCKVVLRALKKCFPKASGTEEALKKWLKHAPKRK